MKEILEGGSMIHDLFCRISFGRAYETRGDLAGDLSHVQAEINMTVRELHSLMSLQDRVDGDAVMRFTGTAAALREEIESAREHLDKLYGERFRLTHLLRDWDMCHYRDGKPIPLPDGIGRDAAFLNVN